MTTAKGERTAKPQSMTAAVDSWLKAHLETGEQPASGIYAAGKGVGFSEDQLRRARRRMKGIVRRVGFPPKCHWSLPVSGGDANGPPASHATPAALASGAPPTPAGDANPAFDPSKPSGFSKMPAYPWN